MYENNSKTKVLKQDLLYPELSYQIIGALFDVFRELGYGYKERYYQKAIETALRSADLSYEIELPVRIAYKGKFIATVYLDFLVEDKIVLELKQGNRFLKQDVEQVHNYLKATNLQLGILARFTRIGVKFLRIVNITK